MSEKASLMGLHLSWMLKDYKETMMSKYPAKEKAT